MNRKTKIFVTGALGQLGNELKIRSKKFKNYEFFFFDIDNFDLTDFNKTKKIIDEVKPDFLINCAAYTAVDKAEDEPDKAFLINSRVPEALVNAVSLYNGYFIHISTDYVFDGKSFLPYNENNKTNPLSIYGKSKAEGEQIVINYEKTIILRTSWLYSVSGNNFVKNILDKGKTHNQLKVIFDQVGTPTYAGDLADAIYVIIVNILNGKFENGIFHYSNEGVASWYDFAWEIINYAKLNCEILPILSFEYPQKAKRPSYSVLNKSKIKNNYSIKIPYWKESLYKVLDLLKKN